MKLIKITAIWCLSCIYMNELLQEELFDYKIINLDYDEDKEEIQKYNIGKILPVYILLNAQGEEINRLVGEKSQKELKEFLLLKENNDYEK